MKAKPPPTPAGSGEKKKDEDAGGLQVSRCEDVYATDHILPIPGLVDLMSSSLASSWDATRILPHPDKLPVEFDSREGHEVDERPTEDYFDTEGWTSR